ncbi:hypothetical protein RUM43_007461, partial [Polyplax serrata]
SIDGDGTNSTTEFFLNTLNHRIRPEFWPYIYIIDGDGLRHPVTKIVDRHNKALLIARQI